jgi:hypothetical protein
MPGVAKVDLQPILAVCQVVISWMSRELLLQGGDNPACIGTGARAASGNEDHAVIAPATGRDRLVVKGSHIDEVVGDDRSMLVACEVNDTTVIKGAPLRMLLDRLDVVTACAQLPGDRRREHLIE